MLRALPARPNTPATTGAATLVPPNTSHWLWPWIGTVSKTATPVAGSATADTSATARRGQPVPTPACPVSWVLNAEQPLPAPFHAVSVQPRLLLARVSDVPPTAVTKRDDAGYDTPNPLSPELAVIATPGWLNGAPLTASEASAPPKLLLMT